MATSEPVETSLRFRNSTIIFAFTLHDRQKRPVLVGLLAQIAVLVQMQELLRFTVLVRVQLLRRVILVRETIRFTLQFGFLVEWLDRSLEVGSDEKVEEQNRIRCVHRDAEYGLVQRHLARSVVQFLGENVAGNVETDEHLRDLRDGDDERNESRHEDAERLERVVGVHDAVDEVVHCARPAVDRVVACGKGEHRGENRGQRDQT